MVRGLDAIVLATSRRKIDDPLGDFAHAALIHCFRGSTENVAERVLECALESQADFFVRINGDSPYLNPDLVTSGLELARLEVPDLVSNIHPRTFPYGISVEIVKTSSFAASIGSFSETEREHPTSFFYSNWTKFRILNLSADYHFDTSLRLVVDTPRDLLNFRFVVDSLGTEFASASLTEILNEFKNADALN